MDQRNLLNAKVHVVRVKNHLFSSVNGGENWPKVAGRILPSSFRHRGLSRGGGGGGGGHPPLYPSLIGGPKVVRISS